MDGMQFRFMPVNDKIDAVFKFRRILEEYFIKQRKLYMCLADLDKAFDRVPRNIVERTMRMKGIPEALMRSAMCLYKAARVLESLR